MQKKLFILNELLINTNFSVLYPMCSDIPSHNSSLIPSFFTPLIPSFLEELNFQPSFNYYKSIISI